MTFPSRVPVSHPLSPEQERSLERLVAKCLPSFDAAADMLISPFSSPGYHTTLKGGSVHRTRESLVFAVALLDTQKKENHEIAARIFRKVLTLQDTDPANPTYGIWPWFLEEPLSQMSPPDWNWADFCGAQLLEALLTRRDLLPAELASEMDRAVLHAARSIQHRDISPGYTNIAIMGTFVTLAAAQSYGLADLHDYAMKRLRRFFDYTVHEQQGAFSEYNSPCYTLIALNELFRLRRYAGNPEAKEMADALYELAWEEIALHFHLPSGQWAGPHSRTYETFLPANAAILFHEITGGRYPRGSSEPGLTDEPHRMLHACPGRLLPYFMEAAAPRTLRKPLYCGDPDLAGTTYLGSRYTLGSVNIGEFWNQRRPLLAYWGSPAAPVCMRPRFLHDGYDFSAAQFFSVQEEGNALFGVAFAVDAGDTHLCLDPIRDGTITAKDLRLRFEFTGPGEEIGIAPPATPDGFAHIDAGPVHVALSVPLAQWGEDRICGWESGGGPDGRWLDLVLHAGEARVFRLAQLGTAAMVAAVGISETWNPPEPVPVDRGERCWRAAWQGLRLGFPTAPDTLARLRASFARGFSV